MKSILTVAALATCMLALAGHETSAAPSHCVGLDQPKCGEAGDCRWQDETTTKTGSKRKAHCRLDTRTAKPEKAAQSPGAAPAASADTKN